MPVRQGVLILDGMKRILVLLALACLPVVSSVVAQVGGQPPPSVASMVAERKRMEEQYRQLRSAYDDLVSALELYRRELEDLREEVRQLKQKDAETVGQYATRSDIERLESQMRQLNEEWNRKREADKELILEQIRKLRQVASAPPPAPTKPGKTEPAAPTYDRGYEYEIQPGDTLSAIVRAYNEQLELGVTVQDVKNANPGIRERDLKPGQTVFIPDPRE